MKPKNRAKILIIGDTMHATLYNAMLRPDGYKIQLFTYAEEGDPKLLPTLCFYTEEILELVLDFQPHLIVSRWDTGIDELLERMERAIGESTRPPVVVIAPKDLWCGNADVCFIGPVDPEELLQAVERLLQEKSNK